MEQSSRRVAELSDRILRIMRQWGTATVEQLENELPETERHMLQAAMERLVGLNRVKPADHSGIYRPK